MATTRIQFINRYPVVRTVQKVPGKPSAGTKQEVEWLFAPVDFKLGLGPCGKVVKELYLNYSDAIATITQVHEDGTGKEFIYQMNDIAGRITHETTDRYEVDYV